MKESNIPKDMFYIKFKAGMLELKEIKEVSWKHNNPKPLIHSDTVIELEATGKAMDKIIELFPSWCPTGNPNGGYKEGAIWFGDFAKTIFGNL